MLIPGHREMRYFQPWPQGRVDDFILPRSMQSRQGSTRVPIGDAVLSMADVRFTLTSSLLVQVTNFLRLGLCIKEG